MSLGFAPLPLCREDVVEVAEHVVHVLQKNGLDACLCGSLAGMMGINEPLDEDDGLGVEWLRIPKVSDEKQLPSIVSDPFR